MASGFVGKIQKNQACPSFFSQRNRPIDFVLKMAKKQTNDKKGEIPSGEVSK